MKCPKCSGNGYIFVNRPLVADGCNIEKDICSECKGSGVVVGSQDDIIEAMQHKEKVDRMVGENCGVDDNTKEYEVEEPEPEEGDRR